MKKFANEDLTRWKVEINAGKGVEMLGIPVPEGTHVMRVLSKSELRQLADKTENAFLKVAADMGINTLWLE